jgi:UDP-perosamine 4-acetyltransferase
MAQTAVVIIGAGGHAKVIIDILQEREDCELAGCVSADPDIHTVLDVPVVGGDDALPGLLSSGVRHAFVAVGENRLRATLTRRAVGLGFSIVNAVSRHAVLSPRVALGAGIAVMPGAVINVDTVVADGAIINTGATVDHDCRIGAYAHLGPGTNLAGTVVIGDGAFLGAGSCVIPGRTVGAWSTVGAGAVVVRDIAEGVTAAGVPARVMKRTGVGA